MPDRFCVTGCGNKIGSMSHAKKCRSCKERDERTAKESNREVRTEKAKQAGLVLVHSCLSNGLIDPSGPCLCRRYVSLERAKDMVAKGMVLDMATRDAVFRGGPVVEKSRLKCPPISSLGQRIAIERKIVRHDYDEKEIARMKATADEDRRSMVEERRCKIDIEHELAIEEQAKLIVRIDEQTFERMKAHSDGRPGIFVAQDDRSSIGRDVGSSNAENERFAEAA
jgi:hypothetical protein